MKVCFAALCILTCVIKALSAAETLPHDEISFVPIEHATMLIQSAKVTIYVDPVGDPKRFSKFAKPDIILITDIHRDHLSSRTIEALKQDATAVFGPKAVIDELGYGEILNNGDSKIFNDINIEAIPMYNLTKTRLKFHPKGRGNGYVITLNKERIYISGDTEDIKEMRSLKNIDHAFVCMNLPYTMTVEQAASAVLEMKPRVVYPYHYRGKPGFSDINTFKRMVSRNSEIEVRLLNWYER